MLSAADCWVSGALAALSPEDVASRLLFPFSSLVQLMCRQAQLCAFSLGAHVHAERRREIELDQPPRSFPSAPPMRHISLACDPEIGSSPSELLVNGVKLPFGVQLPLPSVCPHET